jgi:HAD superfamily hydrolase (TIGR01549 family)
VKPKPSHIKAIIFDFSRVILFPRDISYTGGLNALHKTLSSEDPSYPFFDHFRLNDDLLRSLKQIKHIPLFIFTTGYVQEVPAAKSSLDSIFKSVFSAERLGVSKSDPNTYKKLCNEIGVKPEEVLYIDDSDKNLEAAKEAGLLTHQFTTNKDLLKSLT